MATQTLNLLKRFFLSDHAMLGLICINLVAVFLEESGIRLQLVGAIDMACTLLFVIEMAVKIGHYGWHGYWSRSWNMFDGLLVLVSLPSLLVYLVPQAGGFDLSIVLVFRMLRVFRFVRLFRAFPNFAQIGRNFLRALRDSTPIFLCFILLVLIWSLVTCSFFKELAPQYFATPIDSVYTIFRLCTIEGWYEVPDQISLTLSPWAGQLVRFYFIAIVILGGVIGISLVNSVFVDAMVSDNNDALEAKMDALQKQLDRIEEALKKS